MLCGIGLVLGYALLGAGWLVLKSEGELRDWAWRRIPWLAGDRVLWGVGLHSSIVKASLTAILSAVNRAERDAAA